VLSADVEAAGVVSELDALKRLPVSQTREQFIEDSVSRHVEDLKRRRYWV
jgi:hypothetical protein